MDVTSSSSSFVSSNRILALVYTFSGIFVELLKVIQVDSAVVWCQVLPLLQFTAADDFYWEVIRSYGAKEALSLQASLFKRLSVVTRPCREWAAFVSCFFVSTLAHTSLLISGGAIPACRNSSLTLVGLKHPVIDLHASFSSGSSLEACGDLAQTGHVYAAAE